MDHREQNLHYNVFPRVVKSGAKTEIRIEPRGRFRGFEAEASYRVRHYPTEQLDAANWDYAAAELACRVENGALVVQGEFPVEQMHLLLVEKLLPDKTIPVGEFAIYSLGEDLLGLRPFRGDLHMHSFRSDGREAPAYVAGMCRRIGLDFMALTDHGQYEPSLEAIQAYQGIPLDMAMFPGEEVHAPGNLLHIVNFGGSFSVNTRFREESETYKAEVAAIQAGLGPLPAGVDPYMAASALWCFDEIRRGGGLGIFCHPYWFANHMVRLPEALTSFLLDRQPFDAMEVLGGFWKPESDANGWQIARYYAETARGKRIPAVGVSDSHGCHTGLFGWYSTLVFAASPAFADLTGAIRSLNSVAVDTLAGEVMHIHGPFRLVKYAFFVMNEIMPVHDELCAEEGLLMLAHIDGDETARERLVGVHGRVGRYLERCYGG